MFAARGLWERVKAVVARPVGGRAGAAALAVVVLGALAAGGVLAVNLNSARSGRAAGSGARPGPAAAGAAPSPSATTPRPPPPPLRMLSVAPANAANGVNGGEPVRLTFSAPVAAGSPLPAVSPAVPGAWRRSGDDLVFTPAVPFTPATEVTVQVPAGASGIRSTAGGLLAAPATVRFETAGWSTLRLEQLLAELDYLPVTWTPAGAGNPAAQDRAGQLAAAYAPPAGNFALRPGFPSALSSQWRAGSAGVVLTGALMAFQADHGLTMTGTANAGTWNALLDAVAKGESNPHGYSFALASKARPETLTVWHNGTVVMHGVANTGIAVSPTADGTFPVYLRYRRQVMKGVNPDGSHYADPVQYVSYFNGGDAVHSYYRPSYGFPQSLGCVELPLSEAATVWPYLTYGTLVMVVG